MRRAVLALVIAAGCRSKSEPPPTTGDATNLGDCAAAFAAPAPAGASDHGTFALLAQCTPCGVSWQPLIAISAFDIEAPPTDLPPPATSYAILDACQHSCSSTARTDIADELRGDEIGRAPSTAWRDIGLRCPGALALDDHTRRFARGTWYALSEVARRNPSAERELPLPPLTGASTAIALPRTVGFASWAPRVQVTVGDTTAFVGVLPWVQLSHGALALVPGPGLDYPGDPVDDAHLAGALAKLDAALAGSHHPADADTRVVVMAPRGLAVARVLAVVAKLPGPAWLAGTPRTPGDSAWPEPVLAIGCSLAAGDGAADTLTIDLTAPGLPWPARIAALDWAQPPAGVHLRLPASAQVVDLADALAALSERGVTRALVSQSP